MAEHKKKGGDAGDTGETPKEKQPPRARGGEGKKPEDKIEGPPKPGQNFDVFKLVPLNPVPGPEGWVVNINVYHAKPKQAFFGPQEAEVEIFDPISREQPRVVPIEQFGENIVLPYSRRDRTVQLSVRSRLE